ncbi:MAG: extracellular solute-binding protein [Alphaproteobacteria bacterium]|nr:extracellular solute-binding protein [Alphaproteobacteria bacterium]
MGTDAETLARQTMEQTRRRKADMTRRQMLAATAATAALAGTSLARRRAIAQETKGPGWYTDDKISGKVVMLVSAGQRWELPSRGVLPLFNERFPNIEVDIQPGPHSEMVTKMMTLATSRSSDTDVLYTDFGQWPAFEAAGAMEPLQPYADKDPGWMNDYLNDVPGAISKGYRVPATPEGTLYGLTPDGNAKLHFYRRDLMKEVGMEKIPDTWPEAIALAKALHKPDKDQYGFITTGRRGGFAGWVFWGTLASYGGEWFDKQAEGGWHPTFNNDKGHKALETIVELMKYRHPVTLNATDDECNTALANGTAVYAPIQWGTAVLNNPEYSKFPDVIGTDIVPMGDTPESAHRPLMGGLGQMVSTYSKNKAAAWEWIKHLNSADYVDSRISEAYVQSAGQPSRISLLTKYETLRPHFIGLKKSFPVAVSFVPLIPEAFTLSDILGNETTAVITGEKSIEDALKAMEKGVEGVMMDSGYYG